MNPSAVPALKARRAAIEALPRLSDTIKGAGLAADKRLGQHFLLDPAILNRVAGLAEPLAGKPVLEVGPGPGGLTRALLAGGAHVVAVERDPRCVEALRPLQQAAGGALTLVLRDALGYGLDELPADALPVTIVANLPYNVGTALLLNWLRDLGRVAAMHLMFQKEVALRLTASPGTDAYGRLAVLTSLTCEASRRFDLPPGAFHPPPKVTSAVVTLEPRADRPDDATLKALGRVTAAAFGQRRKMLRSSLKSLNVPPEALAAAAGHPVTARAEELAPAAYLAMARRLIEA